MILEEETYKKFGYYPKDLKRKSSKRILAACDDCGKIRELHKYAYRDLCLSCSMNGNTRCLGYKHTDKSCAKMSESLKGNHHTLGHKLTEEHKQKIGLSLKGRHHTTAAKQKISVTHKGNKNPFFGKRHPEETLRRIGAASKGRYCSEETKRKMRNARKHRRFPKHHTKPELIFETICEQNKLPFHYVGDGQLWIGKKGGKQLNPDFIEANGKKICVEIMGDYWHSPLLNRNMKEGATLVYRMRQYKRYNWQPIFIWETDLLRSDAEAFVLHKLKQLK